MKIAKKTLHILAETTYSEFKQTEEHLKSLSNNYNYFTDEIVAYVLLLNHNINAITIDSIDLDAEKDVCHISAEYDED